MTWQVDTNYPIAFDYYDHLYPHGTMRDNYASGSFNHKLFSLFDRKISVLDLGCSGGGFVKSVIDAGHEAIGLEGSDYSLKHKRAEWATIPNNLFTCDISRPFVIHNDNLDLFKFDVITLWEVIEHIEEDRLPQLFANIINHITDLGLFIFTTAMDAQTPLIEEFNLHRTQKSDEWWIELVSGYGFAQCRDIEVFFGNNWVRRGRNYRHVFRYVEIY